MMKYLLCLLVLLLFPFVLRAQPDVVGVYAETNTAYCMIQDVPGPRTLYVVHWLTYGAVGSQFHIEYSSGFTGTLLSSSSPFANLSGDPLAGVTVMYDGTCQLGPLHILTLDFMLYGNSPACSWVRTAPNPEVYSCGFEWFPGRWEGTHVSSQLECPNDIDYEEHTHFCRPYYEPTLRTESVTWGAVKALYR